jgi:proteasome accessory factor C
MTKLTATDNLSLLLSVAAHLSKNGNSSVADLAKHFGVSEKEIVSTVRTIGFSGVGSYDWGETFELDWSALEDGYVEFSRMVAVEDVPKLSTAEAAIFISGLNYLKSLPEFAADSEIENLLSILQSGSNSPQTHFFEIRPGTQEYDYAKIRSAIANQVRIKCEYTNLKGEHSHRELDPLRLESRDQTFYLQAYCLRDEMVKFFKLDQMRITEVTETPISEAARASEKHDEIFEAAETDIEVVVELEPEAFSIAAEFGASDSVVNLEDGRIRATIRIGYLPYLGKLIAEFGGAAVVVSPPEARAVVRDFALRSLGEAGLNESKLKED